MINSLRECNLRCGTSLMYRLWGRTSQKYVLRSTSHKKFATRMRCAMRYIFDVSPLGTYFAEVRQPSQACDT